MKALRVLPLLLLLAACDAAPSAESALRAGDLTLTTDASAYATGDDVSLTLRNDGDATGEVSQPGCAPLQVQVGSGWTEADAGNDRVCTADIVVLEPGEAATAEVDLGGVPAGTYRFAFGAPGGTVTTAPFAVE